MKALGLILALGFFSNSALAVSPCPARLNSLKNGQPIHVKVGRETYKLAALALKHYRNEIQGGESEYKAYIESAVTYRINGVAGAVVFGHKIDITDGGDESTVTYYFNGKGKLIFGKLHNQSPENFWFCEK